MFRLLMVGAVVVGVIQATPTQAEQHRRAAQTAQAVDGGVRNVPVQLVADRFRRRSSRRRSSRGPSLFGFGIGIGNYYSDRRSGYYEFDPNAFSGYAFDPYTYGQFEAPDLLKDPYFRERNRYDSHFSSPLIPRHTGNHRKLRLQYRD
jgi:hypothetical protein